MRWFHRSATAAPTLVSVLTEAGPSAGAGALLSAHYVLTCAHVVNDALGLGVANADRPSSADRLTIVLHDGDAQHRHQARVWVWVPPRPVPESAWEGDLAVLQLEEPAEASTRAVVWDEMTQGLEVRAWHGGGAHISYADTTIKATDTWFYYADAPLRGSSIGHGYSGGPLVVRDDLTVAVGLVIHHVVNPAPLVDGQPSRLSLVLPWQHIRDELDRAGAQDVLAECLPVSATAPDSGMVPEGVDDLLWKLLENAEQRERHARRTARKLGCQVPPERPGCTPPSAEELAVFLFTEERALATLAESLMKTLRPDQRKTLNDLLALGRSADGPRLLSAAEHHDLLEILGRVNAAHPTLVCRAAQEVLRHHNWLPEYLAIGGELTQEQLSAAVDHIEQYPDVPQGESGASPMAPLLRLAVYLSATVADRSTGQRLDEWCEVVRERLDVDHSLLVDCRAQAARWARFRPRPVTRITVELSPCGPGRPEHYRCAIWLVREGRAPERVRVLDEPSTAEDIGRRIHKVAEKHRQGGGQSPPWIEVVVGRDHVDVPIDSWAVGTMLDVLSGLGLPPSVRVPERSLTLGEEYPVALRLREFSSDTELERRRRRELRRRWEAGYMAPFVIRDEFATAAFKVRDALEDGDTAWVVLHGEPTDRTGFLCLCLSKGVPVVLWDREAAGPEHAQRLEDIVGTVSLPDLPRQIHSFRKAAYNATEPSPARPVMVWDDPEVPLPPAIHLVSPPDAPQDWERTTAT